jgi:hypothetical protein
MIILWNPKIKEVKCNLKIVGNVLFMLHKKSNLILFSHPFWNFYKIFDQKINIFQDAGENTTLNSNA